MVPILRCRKQLHTSGAAQPRMVPGSDTAVPSGLDILLECRRSPRGRCSLGPADIPVNLPPCMGESLDKPGCGWSPLASPCMHGNPSHTRAQLGAGCSGWAGVSGVYLSPHHPTLHGCTSGFSCHLGSPEMGRTVHIWGGILGGCEVNSQA